MTEIAESTRSHNNNNNNNNTSPSSASPSSPSSSLIEKLRQSHPHDHDVMIYPDLPTFRQVYSRATKEALERNEIVFLATTYDSFQKVVDSLTQVGVSVNKEAKEGNLVVLDAGKAYQIDIFGAFEFAKSLVMRAAKDVKTGIFNISDMGSFFLADRMPVLVDYERSLKKKMEIELKAVCSYHKGDFENLSNDQQENILSAHSRIIS